MEQGKIAKGWKECPQCRKVLVVFARICDCGHGFGQGQTRRQKKSKRPKSAAVIIPETDLRNFFHIEDFMETRVQFAKTLMKDMPDQEDLATTYLVDCILGNPRAVISMMRIIAGVSNDKWEEFVLRGLPKEGEAQELCQYSTWPQYTRGAKAGLPREKLPDLERYIRADRNLAEGIARLFFRGGKLRSTADEFWYLRDCKFSMFNEFKSLCNDWQRRIIRDRVAGSYDEISGTYREKFIQSLLSKYAFDVGRADVMTAKSFSKDELPGYGKNRVTSKDIFPSLTGQDLISITPLGHVILAAEISVQRGTGSGITSKSRSISERLAAYKELHPDCETLFGIVIGGHGWTSRQADLRMITKNMDRVWYYTSDGLAGMLMDFGEKLGFPIIREEAVERVKTTHSEFCKEENWKSYCRIDFKEEQQEDNENK